MKEATLSEEVLRDECLPAVVMSRQHAVTAFAVGDQADYLPLYEAFKKHYLKNTVQWSTKDISFVYCLPASVSVEPDFCSRVEVDVYFCRKYVIRLDESPAESLARLPFLPLSPITPGVQTRPPTAQTLLRQRNVKTELARALVVPSASSAAKILAGCLADNFGAADTLQSPIGPATTAEAGEKRVQATLKSIAIENFRAYRKKKEFELGTAVTILYGPNGFGKTSFFDALDFAVTGGVGRLAKAPGGLARVAKHLDGQTAPTEVTLTIEREGETHVIKRTLADLNNAKVDGKDTSRKEVLSLLTGGSAPGADRVDSLVDLFRATHLFSQENQELTQYVASKCELSSELVSRMLAFEDYASGLKKADEVLKLAVQELSKANTEIANASQVIANERKELERLEGLAASDTSTEALDARFAALEEKITTAGFDMTGVTPRDTRGLRASLEAAAAEAVTRRGVLSRAIEQVNALAILREQVDPMHAQLTERQSQMQRAEEHEKEESERLTNLSSQLATLKMQEQTLRLKQEGYSWALSVKPVYDQLTNQAQSLAAGLPALASRITEQRGELEKAAAAHHEALALLEQAEAAVKAASAKRILFQEVKDATLAWEQAEPILIERQAAEIQLQTSINELRRQRNELQQAEHAQELLVANSERELADARSSDSRLKQLISELRGYVDGPSCQLCGHDHGSAEDLLAAIDQRMQHSVRIIQLTEAAATQRASLQTLVGQRQALVARMEQEQLLLNQAQMQRSQLEQQRASAERSLSSVGLSRTSETPQQIQSLAAQAHEDELKSAGALGSTRQGVQTAEAALTSVQAAYRALDGQRETADASLSEIQKRLTELLAQAGQGSINLASSLQELTDTERATEEQRAATSATAQSATEQVDAQKAAQAAAKAAVAATRMSQQQLNQAWIEHQGRIQSILSELTAAKFDTDISPEQLSQQVNTSAAREASALGLRDRVAELEVAVDTAATSAAFESIRQRILAKEVAIQEATTRVQKVQPWVGYFTEVKKLLGAQQAYATEHFISEYGPRTAVIQQRLRPVYGFGEIEITSKDSAIDIRINRKGETLRPTDFFSQSQVQTLILGLFLTACSSQTWSGFSSIMMDDPVTHFDDLNTYALLDLILGLQGSPEGERQFVISTCDEKLLQLARHKFRHLGAAAKFYRFQAIGADGPMVSEISA